MNPDKLFFTSDTHFYHKFMAQTIRGYRDYIAMNAGLIKRWNAKIPKDAVVWHLGDVSFGNPTDTMIILKQLNFKELHLVAGNHDERRIRKLDVWSSVNDLKKIRVEGQTVYLCHYPMLTWPNAHHGTWHLHGHCHGNLRAPTSTRIDVGPEATGQIALSWQEVCDMMETREYDFIDHHSR